MQISLQRINQQLEGQLTIDETVHLDELVKEVQGLKQLDPVVLHATFTKLDKHLYEVDVTESSHAVMTCSRCLTEFKMPLETHWSERFTDVDESATDTEEEVVHLALAQQIDLDPYIRESLLLTIPFAPICSDTCRGLCPVCGVNKNVQDCGCSTERIDPRFAALQNFFNENK